MTDPTAPSLAQRLTLLEGQVDELASGVAAELADVDERLRIAEEGSGVPAPAQVQPAAWSAAATEQDWADLAAWVDWLIVTYDFTLDRTIPACWPAHPGVVEELAALAAAWRLAAISGRTHRDEREMTVWHSQALHPLLQRLKEDYQAAQCARSSTHKPSAVPPLRTDEALLRTSVAERA